MKNYLYNSLIAGFLVIILVSSCKKQLEEKPLSTVSPSNFYKTQADIEAATLGAIGIHASLDLYGWATQLTHMWPAGDFQRGPSDQWENLTFESNWAYSDQLWKANYKLINNINLTLDKMNAVSFDEARKTALRGELLFLRATAYFDLVRLFGKVPIHLTPTTSLDNASLPEASIAEVYDVVVADLKEAETLLSLKNPYGVGYASKGAATGLLVKVYAAMAGFPLNDQSKWAEALEQVKKIVDINNPSVSAQPYSYALEPDFQNLFYLVVSPAFSGSGGTARPIIGKPANENGPEAVYEINFKTTAGLLASAFPTSVSGLRMKEWLRVYFDEGDYRKEVTMVTTDTDPLGGIYLQKKFQSTGTTWNDNENNWPYLRFANLVLYLAEAENEVNGPTPLALRAINVIRERARRGKAGEPARAVPADYTMADAGSKDAFRKLITRERILEFAGEGENWFDWIRTGQLEEQLTFQSRAQYYRPRLVFFPKPQAQVTLSGGKITQNDGY